LFKRKLSCRQRVLMNGLCACEIRPPISGVSRRANTLESLFSTRVEEKKTRSRNLYMHQVECEIINLSSNILRVCPDALGRHWTCSHPRVPAPMLYIQVIFLAPSLAIVLTQGIRASKLFCSKVLSVLVSLTKYYSLRSEISVGNFILI
jgi:hypothetical protein